MAFSKYDMPHVDEALARAKEPLRLCRAKHGVVDDVTFRIRYNGLGEVVVVTIDKGPPGMTPEFIQDSTATVRGIVTFPRTDENGVIAFTDLGAAAATRAADINAGVDQAEAAAAIKERAGNVRLWLLIGGVVIVLYVISQIAKQVQG